jgi:hypothetical protein
MPRFHFEIIDGYTVEDPVGLECKSEAHAIEVAQAIACLIEIDVKSARERKVSIKTNDGREIHKLPIRAS